MRIGQKKFGLDSPTGEVCWSSANRDKAVILFRISNLHLKLDFGPDCRGISKPFKSFQNWAGSMCVAEFFGWLLFALADLATVDHYDYRHDWSEVELSSYH